MKKVLITGVTGFAGSHLAEHILTMPEVMVSGTFLSQKSVANVSTVKDKINLVQIDLQDTTAVAQLIDSVQPDFVYHLAALPAVAESFEKPVVTIVNNVSVQINVLEALRKSKLSHCKILIVTSANVYGKVAPSDLPIDEQTPFNPTNTYAVSKIAQDYLALQYFTSYNMQIIRVRPFNHMGPRQATGFVISDFAKKIAEIEKGLIEPKIAAGNLFPKRDFTDVRDIVRGYTEIMEKGVVGDVYNIGSGKSYKIADILSQMLAMAKVKITVEKDEELLRPSDIPELVCDNSKLIKVTQWAPSIPLKKTLQDTLDFWREIS
jgi:GDP-4-dehydro-6-deoxy-D-mannose reductase